MHISTDKWCKLDAKAKKVMFIGYEPGSKGFQLWDKHTCSINLSWDVTFNKSSFPFLSDQTRSSSTLTPTLIPAIMIPNQIAASQPHTPSSIPLHSSEDAIDNILDRFSV